ncbi:Dynein light chain roadblock-type 2 [Micractinium conductrix]|uniref:Dynein light chain roadblock-type 2 n=1 Tax=Micractinium conductrix TaxID=554055 RepID=A0A2P6UZ06_9CHLO|nr:Dynein light chain roadblock-type 2 [Micractinium conductrix]|eukprot:PSC67071.1 Dynein light chain roadblock-type 2 [Micractinium conductrix]
MTHVAAVEETVKRLSSHKGVVGIAIVNGDGVPIRTTLDPELATTYAALVSQLALKARHMVRELAEDGSDDLQFLRVRSKKHEIMIAPGFDRDHNYTLLVVQQPDAEPSGISVRGVIDTTGIISAAVERYAELCGGAFSGQAVDRTQVIDSVQFFYSPPPRAAVPYAASLRGHDKDPSPPARKSLGFASPRTSAGKENAVGSGGITPRSASALRAHAAPFAGGLPATPPAPHGVGGPHSALSLLPSLPEHMSLAVGDGRAEPSAGCGGVADSPLQCTPSYSTSHAAPARAYSLFGSGGGLAATAGLQYPEAAPFTGGGSFLLSAFEQASTPFLYPAAPPAAAGVERFLVFGGAADAVLPAATPSVPLEQLHRQSSLGSMQVDGLLHRQLSGGGGQMDFSVGGMGPLHRQLSGEDSVLAACGFPAFSTFAQQSQAYFQPSLFEPPAQPVQPPGAATDGGAAHWWEPADAHMQHTQLPATFGLF